ncbi:MAG: hypothetical protein QNI87_01825 [Erythrobacter sp.]|uniref:hypothetical protein n=1 Tax=Erythrobacter sp. TaxID=1042 RepID=UPI00260DBAD3|nr:hypothetical protein [Erythrobacter sp.]MDJ0977253.1 hypothetical protein [Erythrobacter sp.]
MDDTVRGNVFGQGLNIPTLRFADIERRQLQVGRGDGGDGHVTGPFLDIGVMAQTAIGPALRRERDGERKA